MGGFDAYAMQVHVELAGAVLEPESLDAIQRALASAAPSWSSRARLSSLGRWHVGDPFDLTQPGSLEAVIRAWLPGGAKAPPTLVAARTIVEDAEAVVTGADRGAVLSLYIRLDRWPSIFSALLETTAREVDGIPAGLWVERVSRALAQELAPAHMAADSLGERMGRSKRGTKLRRAAWLTYLGEGEAARVDRAALSSVDGVELEEVSGGLLLRLDPSGGPRRGDRYWRRAAEVEALVAPISPAPKLLPRRDEHVPRERARDQSLGPAPSVTVGPRGARLVSGGRYEGVRVAQLRFTDPGGVLEGFEAVCCEFDNVYLGSTKGLARPVVVRHCTITRCKARAFSLGPALIEDCVVDGLAGSPLGAAQVLLRHVVLRGSVDVLWVGEPRRRGLFGEGPDIKAHRAHYAATDWAVDISQARFRRCEIPGVPGRLVRRDPATQVLVTRDRLAGRPIRELTDGTAWWVSLEGLLSSGRDSEVLVACPRSSTFHEELATIARLREAGVAEPD